MCIIRVLIADDQPLVRSGVRASFDSARDIMIVGAVANGRDAVRGVRERQPDVVIMDLRMPRMDGLEATREISRLVNCSAKVVILTMYDQDEDVFDALRAGASGFVLKDAPPEKLIEAVREVASGQGLLSPSVTRRLIAEFARRPALDSASRTAMVDLTQREVDVFRLLVRGYRNDDMARMLFLGESTVKSHVQHLYHKLGVRDRVQVVIYAYENDLV
jgi:DNA-binding NarL/FixJ family response regulator